MNFVTEIGSYFKNLGLSIIGQLKASVASFLNDFVKDDLGGLAVAGVEYANTLTGASNEEKKAAAKAKFIELAKEAGHDAEVFGESVLNFLIEAGLQAVLAAASKGVVSLKG